MDENKIDYSKLLTDENLKEEEISKRQWQILEAAMKVFSEKGFEGSRTSDIAKEAEIAEGTIFRYFKTKKDLLIGLLMPLMTKFFRPMMMKSIEKIMEKSNKSPIEEVIKDILYDRLKLAQKNMALVRTIAIESVYHPELLEPMRKQIAPKVIPIINEFVKKNIDSGKFRDLEPALITRSMMSLLMGEIILKGLFPDNFDLGTDEEEMEKLTDILLHGIANPDK